MKAVKEFMEMPEICRYSSEYGANPDKAEYKADNKEQWIGYLIDGKLVGLTNIHVETGCMCMIHPYILKAYRGKYDDMRVELFKWLADNLPESVVKLNAIIPDKFKSTIKAAKRAGMALEGVDRASYRAANRIHDRLLFGITREELKHG